MKLSTADAEAVGRRRKGEGHLRPWSIEKHGAQRYGSCAAKTA